MLPASVVLAGHAVQVSDRQDARRLGRYDPPTVWKSHRQLPDRAAPLILLALAALVFLPMLGKRDIVTSHEARVAQTARQMAASGWPWNAARVRVPVIEVAAQDGEQILRPARNGATMEVNPWMVPVINGAVRIQKPPLPYWCVAVTNRLLGFGEGQARLPSALLGLLATLLIYDLAGQVLGRRGGVVAALVWMTTYFIIDEHRKSMADPYLAFATLLAVWACVQAGRGRRSAGFILLFYFAVGVGTLAKGPVIFATVAPAVIALAIWRRSFRGLTPLWPQRTLRGQTPLWPHALGFVGLLAIALPWPAYVYEHLPSAIDVWRYESVGEVSGENVEKARPWWFYLPNTFALALPWTPLLIGGITTFFLHGRRGFTGPRGRRRAFALAWYALSILFFSLSHVKKNAYLLPVMPSQVLIISDAILILLAFARRTRFRAMPGILATAQALIGVGFAASVTALMFGAQLDRSAGVAVGAVATVVCVTALWSIWRAKPATWLAAQSIGYVLILIALLGFHRPDYENRRSAKPFARALRSYMSDATPPLLAGTVPEELSIYLPMPLKTSADARQVLVVIDHSRKDPEETPESLSRQFGEIILQVRRIPLTPEDGNGRWRLFELIIDRRRA